MHLDDEEKQIRESSDKNFQDHQVTELSRNGVFRSWRCAKPGTGVYSFTITTTPGHLIVTGDIGDLIVARIYDMLPWCRASVDDTRYFASKVPQCIPTREFSHSALEKWVRESIASDDTPEEHRAILRDARHLEENGPDYWYREFSEVWDGCDPPNWQVWNYNFLWCRDAIRWFVTHHDESDLNKAN